MPERFDFSGYATRNDIKCMDGRTIRKDAFRECNGTRVPLVWQHQHNESSNVLGHAILENRDDGVYAYGYFNDTPSGRNARELVEHGDVRALSIYANSLKQKGGDVLHGVIREVSLVLAGANPGAFIDYLNLEHGDNDDFEDGEAIIYGGSEVELFHEAEASTDDATEEIIAHADNNKEETKMADRTVQEVFDGMTEEEKNVVYFMIGQALEQGAAEHDAFYEEDGDYMKHNAFENDAPTNYLSHADQELIFEDAKRLGSLKAAVQQHMESGVLSHAVYDDDGNVVDYGIANIDYLFPEAHELNDSPDFIERDKDWVSVVMNGVHHTPFSRVKTTHANITMDEARAKGYMKGNRKEEEVFSLLRRSVDPQTVYKKQKLDRDDILDITDLNVVAYIKSEMRKQLDEECARAMLIGDGRLGSDPDKIFAQHVRPILGDDELYSIPVHVTAGADAVATTKNMIRAFIKARKNYKGSGNLTFFTTEDWLSEALLLEDGFGKSLYEDSAALAKKLRVSRIVTVPVMEGITDENGHEVAAIAVDLRDYNVGADKGGAVNMFDDFDIDYNQYKYLIETRFSGMLIKPFSAMVVVIGGSATTYTEATATFAEETVASGANPKALGLYEKVGDDYVRTADTTKDGSKTYYKCTTNPKSSGWYVKQGALYTLTADTVYDPEKVYYTRS